MIGLAGSFASIAGNEESKFKTLAEELLVSSVSRWHAQDNLTLFIRGQITRVLGSGFEQKLEPKNYPALVANYYQKYGQEFYQFLDGPFFILLWDRQAKKLCLCNNRHQCSNLYYYERGDGFLFAHSLTDLLKYIPEKKPFTPSILSFVSNGFTYSDQTQIAGVRKLLPSFGLVWENHQLSLINHWEGELQFNRQAFDNLEKHLDRYELTYRDVVSSYLEQKHPRELGCLLSGGHDTSFAVIQANKVFSRPLHTFTVTFPNWAFNEERYAKNIAEKFGCHFHPVPFTADKMDKVISMIRAVEEPVVGVALPLQILAEEASQHVDVLLGGDGGDTIWGEYYPVAEYHRYVKYLPLRWRKSLYQMAKGLVRFTDWERFWELEHVASLFAQPNYHDQFMRKLCTYRHFTDSFQSQLFVPEFYGQGEMARSVLEVPFTNEKFRESLIEGKLFNAFYNYMGFSQTKIMENSGMSFFMPTVQKPVLDFICKLPYQWVNGGTTFHRLVNSKSVNRRFHKKALARYLKSEEIYNRSFDIPWYNILKPRHDILSVLKRSLLKRGWYRESTLNQIWKEFQYQSVKDYELLELKHHGYRIFTLLSLEVWSRMYLDGKISESTDIPLIDFLND